MTPHRTVLAIGTSGPGGAEQIVLQLATFLRERGALPIIATFRPGWLTDGAERAGIGIWLVPQRPGPDPLWVLQFARRLRREGVQVLHTHEFELNAYGGAAAALARLPSLATLHGSVWGLDLGRHRRAYRLLQRAGQRLVAVSQDLARLVARRLGLSPNAIEVVPNGIPIPSVPEFDQRDESRLRARAELGIPVGGPLLLAVGNLYPVKDHANLLRAAARMPGAHVAIAGRGEEEEPLRRLAAGLAISERLHLLGLREEIGEVLLAADVFVQPSRSEGLPLAVLEAMAAGLPVVATRVGGVPEAVEDGRTGYLVPAGDSAALADGLRKVVEAPDRGAALARAGRLRARQQFSVERMGARYAELYAALFRGRS